MRLPSRNFGRCRLVCRRNQSMCRKSIYLFTLFLPLSPSASSTLDAAQLGSQFITIHCDSGHSMLRTASGHKSNAYEMCERDDIQNGLLSLSINVLGPHAIRNMNKNDTADGGRGG